MSDTDRIIIEFEKPGLKAHGIFKKGRKGLRNLKPLIVLIHGGGCNASYFDNDFHSVPKAFNESGFNVLSINRVGYAHNPLPQSASPVLDSIPLYSALIKKSYEEHSNGKNGIVLVGHSLGAVTSLSIAAFEGEKLPLLGVSALGIIPTKDHPAGLVDMLKADPENPRFIVEASPEAIEAFMGPPSVIDSSILVHPTMPLIFEPGLKSELLEWWDLSWYNRFVNEVAPGVRVPLQFLAAEYELGWKGIKDGQPIFDHAAGLFTNTPKLDARLLPGGGHNFEFSRNASLLQKAREEFVNGLISSSPKTAHDPDAFSEIPLLDFALANDIATKPKFLESLRRAIVNVGFLYIKNPPVSIATQETLIKKGIELFDLPLEEKLKIEMANSKHFLGYARLGTEITAMKPDYREQFDFATEVPAPRPDEPVWQNLRGPNQWPDESVIPGFRVAVENYMNEIQNLALSFSRLIAEALDMDPNSFDKFFDIPQHNKLKLVKYPAPPSDAENPEGGVQGVGPHKDGSFLTFLLQLAPHTGLEIQNKSGNWIKAPPIPGTLVINIGRSLQALTKGVCTATTHRVNLSPENYISEDGTPLGPRYSFPVFQGVKTDGKDNSLEIPQHIKYLVKDEKVRSEAEATFDKMFNGGESVREAIFISRITSHQDVGARWYPDLLAKALKEQGKFKAGA